jgi:hypothetical protein
MKLESIFSAEIWKGNSGIRCRNAGQYNATDGEICERRELWEGGGVKEEKWPFIRDLWLTWMEASLFDYKSELSVGNFRYRANILTVSDDGTSKQISLKVTWSTEQLHRLFRFISSFTQVARLRTYTITITTICTITVRATLLIVA